MTIGFEAGLLMDSAAPIDGSSESYAFASCNLVPDITINTDQSVRGTRYRRAERNHIDNIAIDGQIVFDRPSPAELDNLLPRILGAAESTDTFAMAETIPEFLIAYNQGQNFYTYTGCKVATATFSSSTGGPMQLALSVIGKTYTSTASGSFPSVAVDTDNHYSHSQSVVTVNSVAHNVSDIEIVIDNGLQAFFENSQTATSIDETDSIVRFNFDTPHTSSSETLWAAIDDATTIGASVVYTNGDQSLTFTFNDLQIDTLSGVSTPNRTSKLRSPFSLVAHADNSNNPLVVTHDSTA